MTAKHRIAFSALLLGAFLSGCSSQQAAPPAVSPARAAGAGTSGPPPQAQGVIDAQRSANQAQVEAMRHASAGKPK